VHIDANRSGRRWGERIKPVRCCRDWRVAIVAVMTDATAATPGRIFISYRRDETAYPAGWLYERLADHFGKSRIFKDVDSIQLGDDFVEVITSAVGSCDVLLALIGDQWLTITDEHGKRRLDDPEDFVRLEIEAALARDVRVVPILVEGATMPSADELPAGLAMLARRQALDLSPSRFDFDLGRLLKVLDRTVGEVNTPSTTESELADPSTTDAGGAADPDPPSLRAGTGTRPAVKDDAAPPSGPVPPADPTEPATKQRHRLSTRARVLAAVGVASAVIALVIVAIAASSNTDPPAEGVIYSDDFSDQAAEWTDANDDSTLGYYTDDAYRIHAEPRDEGGGELSSPRSAASVYPSAPSNIRIDVEARRILGGEPHAYGILCRLDGLNYYAMSAGEEFVSIEKYVGVEPYYFELAYEPVAYDVSATNQLQASCTSDDGESVHLEFSVNGSVVAEATDTDDPLSGGTVGLWVAMAPGASDATEAEFDNFVVTEL
jgi:TIR domain